jgi:D-arabinitol 4-dehydrogenase
LTAGSTDGDNEQRFDQRVLPFEEDGRTLIAFGAEASTRILAGLHYIHEGTRDARIRGFAHAYVSDDAIPVLQPSPINLEAYRDTVLDRFANAAIGDTNQRVAMDGFSKIPGFIAPTVRERLARGQSIAGVAMLPALFLAFLQRWHRGVLPFVYQDQAMDPAVAHALCESADPAAALCALPVLWGPEAGDPRLVAAVREASARVSEFVAHAT